MSYNYRYRKRPVQIEAFLLNVEPIPPWFIEAMDSGVAQRRNEHAFDIHTLEGTMVAKSGEWIIRGIEGEIYPCKPEIFSKTYEKFDPDL